MKVCFSAIPAYGHVFPMVPLAAAAAEAGHEVSFVASDDFRHDDPDLRRAVRATRDEIAAMPTPAQVIGALADRYGR